MCLLCSDFYSLRYKCFMTKIRLTSLLVAHSLLCPLYTITGPVKSSRKRGFFAFSSLSTPWCFLCIFCPLQGIKAHKTESLWDLCLFFNLQGVISEFHGVETPKFQSKAACSFCAIFPPHDLPQSSAPSSNVIIPWSVAPLKEEAEVAACNSDFWGQSPSSPSPSFYRRNIWGYKSCGDLLLLSFATTASTASGLFFPRWVFDGEVATWQ